MAIQTKAAIITDGDQLNQNFFNDTSGVVTIEAGEATTAGRVGYLNISDGKAYTGDLATQNDIRANGIFLTAVSSGADVVMQTGGVYTTTGLTDKATYYLGVDGALITTRTAVKIGVANGTTQLILDIVQDDSGDVGDTKMVQIFGTADSGTTDGSTTANKLIQSGQNFTTTVEPGMRIRNTTDSTDTYVTAVDSDTQLSVADDIMATGENYTIYKTKQHNAFWQRMDGTTISNAESPWNGVTVQDWNGNGRFIKAGDTSNTETAAATHRHSIGQFSIVQNSGGWSIGVESNTDYTTAPDPINVSAIFLVKII